MINADKTNSKAGKKAISKEKKTAFPKIKKILQLPPENNTTNTIFMVEENVLVPHDGIYNEAILTNEKNWFIPTWEQLGFSGKAALAQRKGQTAYKNKVVGTVLNAGFDKKNMENIANGYDPLGQYKIKDVPCTFNVGSNGVGAWFEFLPIPKGLFDGIELQNPVYADRNLQQYVLHQGIDYNSSPELKGKQKVVAAYDSVVFKVSSDSTSGNYIVLKHEYGSGNIFYTVYMHLSQPKGITVGMEIKKGEWFANVGNTGSASGLYSTHLHFEVRDNSYTGYYDPIAFLGVERINRKM